MDKFYSHYLTMSPVNKWMSAVWLSLKFNRCLTHKSGVGVWLHAVVKDSEALNGVAAQTEINRER
jgi:hypothetical protein